MKKVPVECYTRIVGYYRPMNQANAGKRAEISERVLYKMPEELKNDNQ